LLANRRNLITQRLQQLSGGRGGYAAFELGRGAAQHVGERRRHTRGVVAQRRDLRLQRIGRLRGHLRVLDDQRQVLRDVVQVGNDGIDRPAGAVSLQHGVKGFELRFDSGAGRAILGIEKCGGR